MFGLSQLFEVYNSAEGLTYPDIVRSEVDVLLNEIRRAAKADDLLKLLTQESGDYGVADAVYLLARSSPLWKYTEDSPLMVALKANEQLVDLFIAVCQHAWPWQLRFAAAQVLAQFVRAVGKETEIGAKVYRQAIEPWFADLDNDGGHLPMDALRVLALSGEPCVVPLLLDALDSREEMERYFAAELLLKDYGDERALDVALEALQHAELEEVRYLIAQVLRDIDHPRVVAAFARAIQDASWKVRWTAVQVLRERGDDSHMGVLILALDDEESLIRNEAIGALGEIGDSRAAGALAHIVCYHEDEDSRRCAAKSLKQLDDPLTMDVFARALQDEDEHVRWEALAALEELGDDSALPSLILALHDDEPRIRHGAIRVLAKIADSRATQAVGGIAPDDQGKRIGQLAAEGLAATAGLTVAPLVVSSLVAGLPDLEPVVQRYAARAIGKLGHLETVIPLLNNVPEEQGSIVRHWKAVVRVWLKDSDAVGLCLEALHCDEAEVRAGALDALAFVGIEQLGADRLFEICFDMLGGDEEAEVRTSAVRGLGTVATQDAVLVLREVLCDEREAPLTRFSAASSLSEIRTPEASEALIGALNDPNGYVRLVVLAELGYDKSTERLLELARVTAESGKDIKNPVLARLVRELIEQIQKRSGQ